jgi:hypothetical protein
MQGPSAEAGSSKPLLCTVNRAPGELPACLSAFIEEVVMARGTGTPRSREKGKAAAPEAPGALDRRPGSPPGEREHRLYERAAPANPQIPGGLEGLAGRYGDDVRRWCRWVTRGLASASGWQVRLSRNCRSSPATNPRAKTDDAERRSGQNQAARLGHRGGGANIHFEAIRRGPSSPGISVGAGR